MKFYKITNITECHIGLQYHTGLNVDILPFNPSGDCEPGGIYFSSKDILAFLDYGPWIREVIIPEDAQVYENPGFPKKWKADKVILGERRRITVDVVKELIEEGADPKADNSYALQLAAESGHIEIVRLLIPVSDPKSRNSQALRLAAKHGHTEIVKLLIPVSDPKAYNSYALQLAAKYGHTEIVKLLIPVSDPKACDSYVIRCAANNGYMEVVKLLIPVLDEKVVNSDLVQNILISLS
jgi:hypothetical protein